MPGRDRDIDGCDAQGGSPVAGEPRLRPATPSQGKDAAPTPLRVRRLRRTVWRWVRRHERPLAVLLGVAVAVVLHWPALVDPAHTVPQDVGDPTLQAWQLAWSGHAILTDPVNLWHGNGFYPEAYSLAFSDSLLGYAPFGFLGSGPEAAIFRYNILYVLAHALAFVGAYALARQLGAARLASVVAGLAFAFAPWRMAHAGHLNVLSTGGVVLALAMLAHGHGFSLRRGFRLRRMKPWWVLGGWLVAAWQMSLGFAIGLPFGYVLALLALAALAAYGLTWVRHRMRPVLPGRLLAADLSGGAVFAAVTLLMAQPYLRVMDLHPGARRGLAEVETFSPPVRGLLTAPAGSWLWGARHAGARSELLWPAEMTLLPGVVLVCVAVGGLIFSVWRVWIRLVLALGVVLSVVLVLGTTFGGDGNPGYVTLYHVLPGWDAMRASGRLILWTTLLLALLAAGALTGIAALARDLGGWAKAALWVVTMVPLAGVAAESVNAVPHPRVIEQPAATRDVVGPVLVLPAEGLLENNVLLWSTDGFPKVVNGISGVTPASHGKIRARTAHFPDARSVQYLRRLGVRTVIWLPRYAATAERWQQVGNLPVEGLGITRTVVGDAVVFRLS
jgi:hypothetical protein